MGKKKLAEKIDEVTTPEAVTVTGEPGKAAGAPMRKADDLVEQIKALPLDNLTSITVSPGSGTTRYLAYKLKAEPADVSRALRQLVDDGWLVEAGAGTYSPAHKAAGAPMRKAGKFKVGDKVYHSKYGTGRNKPAKGYNPDTKTWERK